MGSFYTEGGMRTHSEMHMEQHYKDDRKLLIAFQNALNAPRFPASQQLHINWADIGFLKTRGIQIDEDIIYEPSLKYEMNEEKGIKENTWKRILEKIWPIKTNKT